MFNRFKCAFHVLLGKPLMYKIHIAVEAGICTFHEPKDTWIINSTFTYEEKQYETPLKWVNKKEYL